jgi:hypothetical protein
MNVNMGNGWNGFWIFLALMIIFFATNQVRLQPDLQDAIIYKLTGEKNWEHRK